MGVSCPEAAENKIHTDSVEKKWDKGVDTVRKHFPRIKREEVQKQENQGTG